MNHRELIQSADRKYRHLFRSLPDDVQDRIVDGLDNGTMTLTEASAIALEAGLKISIEAISDYYRAVRRERRLRMVQDSLKRVLESFAGTSFEDNTKVLLNLSLATAIQGLADGEIGIKDLDLARILMAAKSGQGGKLPAEVQAKVEKLQAGSLSPGQVKKIKEEVYGIYDEPK